jgi:hypothetical protein
LQFCDGDRIYDGGIEKGRRTKVSPPLRWAQSDFRLGGRRHFCFAVVASRPARAAARLGPLLFRDFGLFLVVTSDRRWQGLEGDSLAGPVPTVGAIAGLSLIRATIFG